MAAKRKSSDSSEKPKKYKLRRSTASVIEYQEGKALKKKELVIRKREIN